jgi:hypothetical protein
MGSRVVEVFLVVRHYAVQVSLAQDQEVIQNEHDVSGKNRASEESEAWPSRWFNRVARHCHKRSSLV